MIPPTKWGSDIWTAPKGKGYKKLNFFPSQTLRCQILHKHVLDKLYMPDNIHNILMKSVNPNNISQVFIINTHPTFLVDYKCNIFR